MVQLRSVLSALFLFAVAFWSVTSAQAADAEVTERFEKLLADEWQWKLKDDPEFSSWLGDYRYAEPG